MIWTKSPDSGGNYQKHQITLSMEHLGFSSLDIIDRDEPKYQIRSPYEITSAITSTGELYSDCFLLHSTDSAQKNDGFLQIIYGTEDWFFQQHNSIGYCFSAEARMNEGFADFFSLVSDQPAAKQNSSREMSTFFGIQQEDVISTTLWLKKCSAINPICRNCLEH